MIKTIWIKNPSGDTLELNLRSSDRDEGLLIFNIEGLGPPKGFIYGSGGPNFDGTRVDSVRTDNRVISMTLAVSEAGPLEEAVKQKIYTFFPIKQTVLLSIKTDTKHVDIYAIVESNEMNQFAAVENSVLSLVCPKPYLVDKLVRDLVISGTGEVPLFEFPFENDSLTKPLLIFGEILAVPAADILYPGEVKTGILMALVMRDYVHDVTIINANGNQTMFLDFTSAEDFFGDPVQDGDQVFINTKIQEKSIFFVRNDVFFDMLNGVDIDSDWIELRPGGNRITVSADVGTGYLDTQIIYRALREGV